MAGQLSREEVLQLAGRTGAPDDEGMLSPDEVRKLARGEGTPGALDIAGELPRAAARGAAGAVEFFNDLTDWAPGPMLAGAVAEAATTERTLPQTLGEVGEQMLAPHRAYKRSRAGGAGVLPSAWEGLKATMTQDTAAERMRGKVGELAAPLTERGIGPAGPVGEGLITGAEFLGGAAAVPGPGMFTAPLRGGAREIAKRVATSAPVAMAGGAGAGRTAAEYAELGEGGTLAAELGGAVVGLLGRNVKDLPRYLGSIKRTLDTLGGGEGADSIRRYALSVLREMADSPDVAIQRIRQAVRDKDIGTLAQVSDDPGIRGAEKAFTRVVEDKGVLLPQIEEATRAARAQALERVGALAPEGQAARGAAPVKARVLRAAQEARTRSGAAQGRVEATTAEEVGEAGTRLSRALAASDEAKGRLSGLPDVEDAGRVVDETVGAARTAAREAEAAAWKSVPRNELLPTTKLRAGLDQALTELTGPVRTAFKPVIDKVYAMVDDMGAQTTGAELNDLRSLINDTIESGVKAGVVPAGKQARVATKLADAVKQVLDDSKGGPAFQAARQATRERFSTFDEGILGKAVRATREATGGAPAQLGERLAPAGTKGGAAVRATQAAGPEATEALGQSLLSRFRAKLDQGAGPARTFLRNEEAALKEFPELRAQMDDILGQVEQGAQVAKETPGVVRAAERAGEGRIGVLERTRAARERGIKASPAGQFGMAEDAVTAADSALSGVNRVRKTQQVMRGLEGAAREDAKAAFREAMLRKMTDSAGNFNKGAIRQIKSNRRALANVFDADEMRAFEKAVETGQRLFTEGAISAREATALTGHPVFVALSRIVGAKIGGTVSGQPLIASNMASSAVRKLLERMPQTQYMRAIGDYFAHPERYIKDLDRLGTERVSPAEAAKLLERILGTPGAVGVAGSRVTEGE